jgi:hypothetical protein
MAVFVDPAAMCNDYGSDRGFHKDAGLCERPRYVAGQVGKGEQRPAFAGPSGAFE